MLRKFISAAFAVFAISLLAGSATAQMKKVRIGTEGAYPPFNFIDSDGKLQGFDVDIANALCAAAKFDCEFVVQDWDGMIPGLLAKKYDAIIASMSITEERMQQVDFTDKYYPSLAKFAAKVGAKHEITKEGLKGMSVGVQRATTHETFLQDNFGDAIQIRSYATQDEANADLVSGRVDLILADAIALDEGFLKTDAGKGFAFIGPDFSDPKWFGDGAGIAIRKGEDDLRSALNKAIKQIRADGTYKKINDKYFDFEIYPG